MGTKAMATAAALVEARDAFASAMTAHHATRTLETQADMNTARLRFARAVLDYAGERPMLIAGREPAELRQVLDADVDHRGFAGSLAGTDALFVIDRAGQELARRIESERP